MSLPHGTVGADLCVEVHQLLAAYGHAIDACDGAAWAELFHSEGTSAGPGRPTLRGRRELAAWVAANPRPDLLHTTSNIQIVRVDRAAVHVRSHFTVVQMDGQGVWSVMVAGSYRDVLAREGGELRILERTAVGRGADVVDITANHNHD